MTDNIDCKSFLLGEELFSNVSGTGDEELYICFYWLFSVLNLYGIIKALLLCHLQVFKRIFPKSLLIDYELGPANGGVSIKLWKRQMQSSIVYRQT